MRFSVQSNASLVQIDVFNVEGRRVRTLVDRHLTAGTHVVGWDTLNTGGSRVAPGFYFARLMINGEAQGGKKMIVLR